MSRCLIAAGLEEVSRLALLLPCIIASVILERFFDDFTFERHRLESISLVGDSQHGLRKFCCFSVNFVLSAKSDGVCSEFLRLVLRLPSEQNNEMKKAVNVSVHHLRGNASYRNCTWFGGGM